MRAAPSGRPSRRHVLGGLAGATGFAAAAAFSLPRPSVTPQADASVAPATDGRRTLIVTARDSTSVALIAYDENRLIGHLDLGIVPLELRMSDGGVLLAAADRQSRQLAVAEVAARTVRRLDLPCRPTRLLVSPDGATLAAIDEDSGEIAVIEFRSGRIALCFPGPAHIRAVIFSPDGALLFVGADTFQGVAVFDLASGRLAATIDSPPVVDLVRSPNGREGFAITADPQHAILHLDLKARSVLGRLTGRPAAGVFTTGFGRYLLLPDPDAGTMTIASVEPLQPGPLLAAAAGVSTAYSAWFDTVAFVPSAPAHKVFVYDLEAGRNDGAIALAGRPGFGSMSPVGDKFYLPVEDSGEVVVIDTRDRRQTGTISVGGAPVRAVIAAGYGICH
nr:WD40 repeat domain-containing protein [uncultured Rhodopila sp.]